MGGLRIPRKKNMSLKEDILNFNKPKYVYIPLIAFHDEDITVLVKKGDYVCKMDEIGRKKGNFKVPIYSSVSGKVIDIEEHDHISGKKVKCVVIENDFKEEVKDLKETTDKINKFSKEEFIDIVKNAGIVGLGGAGFPTYAKYDTDTKIKVLVVNAIECEPYITADAMHIKGHVEELLEAVDAVLTINNIEKAVLAIRKDNTVLIDAVKEYIGSYLNIELKILKNIYPMGWERLLIKEALHVTYDRLPIEKGIVVNNASTMFAIFEALKYNKPLTERVVTFSGEGLKHPRNVLVKIGTKVEDVLNELGYNKKDKLLIVAGGPMMGITSSADLVISADVNAVLLLKDVMYDSVRCIRCGKCNLVCPANLYPVLIKDFYKNKDKLIKLEPNKCVECGLCSYICPSKINVREYVREAKKNIK